MDQKLDMALGTRFELLSNNCHATTRIYEKSNHHFPSRHGHSACYNCKFSSISSNKEMNTSPTWYNVVDYSHGLKDKNAKFVLGRASAVYVIVSVIYSILGHQDLKIKCLDFLRLLSEL